MSSGSSSSNTGSSLGDYKQEKLSTLQKNLLVRWINTLDVCENYLSADNIVEELKSGILLCNILKFHQPNLDFTGVNEKARAKKQCLNNIERALSILYQKGAPPRFVPTAEEIFDGGEKQGEKIWLLLRTIFDIFAMHDVSLLLAKIVKWLNKSLSYLPGLRIEPLSSLPEDIYQEFKTGVDLAGILALYGPQDQPEYLPDFRMIYQYPQNRQEVMSNLSYVFNLAIKNNVPIYLKPAEYLEYDQHNFLLLQLYYLYCKFKNTKPAYSRSRGDTLPQLIFKDEGRILEDNSQTSGGMSSSQQTNTNHHHPNNLTSPQTQVNSSSGSRSGATTMTPTPPQQRSAQGGTSMTGGAGQDSEEQKTMGIIDEVDSVDFSSTMKSSTRNTGASQENGVQTFQVKGSKINHQKVQAFLQSQQQQQNTSGNAGRNKGGFQTPNRQQQYRGEEDEEEGNVEYDGGVKAEDTFQGRSPVAVNQRFGGATNDSRRQLEVNRGQQQLRQSDHQSKNSILDTSQRQNYQAVVDENIGIFSSQLEDQTLGSPQAYKQQPQVIKPHIDERRAFFMEDLRSQLMIAKQHITQAPQHMNRSIEQLNTQVNEDHLLQMYYSSAGGAVNQTAQFINNNNFNTIDTVSISAAAPPQQNFSILEQAQPLPSTSQFVQRTNTMNTAPTKTARDLLDENGEMDELKCLTFLMVPQLATIHSLSQPGSTPQRVFISIKPAESCYSELTEGYTLKIIDYQSIKQRQGARGSKLLHEINLAQVESILMKNLIQKQFVVTWTGNQSQTRLAIETIDKSDVFFQALNFIHQHPNTTHASTTTIGGSSWMNPIIKR